VVAGCHRTIRLIALMVLCCDLLTIAAVASAKIQPVTTVDASATVGAARELLRAETTGHWIFHPH
jgi:hypothetical protein